jgi:hypothetical protein
VPGALKDSEVFEFWVSLLFLPSVAHSQLALGSSTRSPTGCPTPGVRLRCGQPVSPTWDNVQRTLQPCTYCAGRRIDSAIATGKLLAREVCTPIEPFSLSSAPWRVRCNFCGRSCVTTYNKVVNQERGPCRVCAPHHGGRSKSEANWQQCLAVLNDGAHEGYQLLGRTMREKGNKRELYVQVRCPAGHEYEVYAYSWRSGSRCASCLEHGFRIESSSHLYVVAGGGWLKVGISNDGSLDARLAQHAAQGMSTVLALISFETGRDAQAAEDLWKWQYIVALGIEHRATAGEIPDGHSETIRDSPQHRAWIVDELLPMAALQANGVPLPMATLLCDVVPCGKRAMRRGYRAMCSMHATRMRLHGSPYTVLTERRAPPADGLCVEVGCQAPHLARGLCRAHYQADRKRRIKEESARQ